MPRLLFEKKGNAIWISHLDLMRVFQRSFKRAGLPLTHTKGFNPRPWASKAAASYWTSTWTASRFRRQKSSAG